MSYTVLARKHRPQTFAALVGQDHIAKTLGNAIAAGRIAHAFLFTGVRGVGKTTTARLLAKALNCAEGPTATPCNVCSQCTEITAGNDMDVLEMDGASNNSVEDVRRLQESIPYRPSRDRYKVIIVDEVHMLSTGAFNAFLKTLEEPPPHVKFIFATTESHKVPVTIRSRCQRYDFRLIPQATIADSISAILTQEGLTADQKAIAIVAREAAGSMRDALTLLDQLVAIGGETLDGDSVAQALGIAGRDQVFRTAEALLRGDGRAALLAVAEVENRGLDTLHFSRQLLSLMRDLVVMVVTDGGEELTDLLSDEQRMASEILAGIDGLEVQRAFYALSRLVDEIGRSASPRTVLEMGLVRIATRPPLRSLAEILARLEALEAGGHRGGPRSGSAGQGGGYRGGAGAGSRAGSGSGAAAGSRAEPGGDRAPSQASSAAAQENAADRSAGGDRGASQANQRPPTPDRSTRTDEGGAADRALAPDAQQPPAEVSPAAPPPPSRVDPEGHRDEALGSDPQPAVANASREMDTGPGSALRPPGEANLGSAPPTGSADHAASIPDEGDAVLTSWQRIIDKLGDQRPALAAILEHGVPVRVDGDAVEIAFPQGSFFGRQAEADDATDALAVSAAEVMGRRPKIIIAYSTTKGEGRTVAQLQATRREDRREAIRQEALNHPRVLEAMQVFPASAGNVEVHIDGD